MVSVVKMLVTFHGGERQKLLKRETQGYLIQVILSIKIKITGTKTISKTIPASVTRPQGLNWPKMLYRYLFAFL